MKKIIAITQSIEFVIKRKEYRDYIDNKLIKWINDCGFSVILISNFFKQNNSRYIIQKKKLLKFLKIFKISGFILSGGNNIGQYTMRDEVEKTILSYAEKKKIPVLGICRGLQMINYFYSGVNVTVKNHANVSHNIYSVKNKKKLSKVTCFHNYTIKNLAKNFVITHKSDDNFIEGIKHKNLKIQGWMWHPEREININKKNKKELLNFFK